ncbi:hypothetical protein J437_LFUL009005 [Ladona fulva]|uniref:C2H2-type domain-containing protein n=1 Tax=Ladona fulva TaxID=123851 RepID=A0A8K0K721_LADFU|nr:hypothetical protein J437_LFUL009005 [Ladona fulva]
MEINWKECGVEIKREAVEEVVHGEKRKLKDELREHIYSKHLSFFVGDHGEADEDRVERDKCTFCPKGFKCNSYLLKLIRSH